MDTSLKTSDSSQVLGNKELGILKVLLLFTCVMFIVPIISYFAMKSWLFEGVLGYENGAVNAAIGTVVIVHVIIGWYIWMAVKEDNEDRRPTKRD
ncbi:uncharacterized protein LOC135685958 [Rhopilema esculentum]|uniref:uncharacterized protein LOC135685958 n=1 Tax=Rhopilema esculentum TaxID=499914 RepID=UPI0031D892E8